MATQTRRRSTSRTTKSSTQAQTQINTEDIGQLEAGRQLLVQQLEEAFATEAALVSTLRAHISMTPKGSYRRILERHLGETQDQAGAIQDRLGELGANRSIVAVGFGAAQTVVGQALALGKGPIDMIRGKAGEEKLFKNAKDECATEALEIATYDGLEATARAIGDVKTADLAVRHREQEERMLGQLREELPKLADAMVRALVAGDSSYDPSKTGAADAVRKVRDEVEDEADEIRDDVRKTGKAAASRAKRTTRKATASAKRTTGSAKRSTKRTATSAKRSAARSTTASSTGSNGSAPISGYDDLTAEEINGRLSDLTPAQLRKVETYEKSHDNRSTVIERIKTLRSNA